MDAPPILPHFKPLLDESSKRLNQSATTLAKASLKVDDVPAGIILCKKLLCGVCVCVNIEEQTSMVRGHSSAFTSVNARLRACCFVLSLPHRLLSSIHPLRGGTVGKPAAMSPAPCAQTNEVRQNTLCHVRDGKRRVWLIKECKWQDNIRYIIDIYIYVYII